jgi:hypothetical protein
MLVVAKTISIIDMNGGEPPKRFNRETLDGKQQLAATILQPSNIVTPIDPSIWTVFTS